MTTELFCNARKERPVFLHDKTDGIIFSHHLQHNDSMQRSIWGGRDAGKWCPILPPGYDQKGPESFSSAGILPHKSR